MLTLEALRYADSWHPWAAHLLPRRLKLDVALALQQRNEYVLGFACRMRRR